MSSATSIDKVLPPEGGSHKQHTRGFHLQAEDQPADAGFRPWHFFVLASLMTATVAVVVSRQGTPEHLVLLSLTIAAAGAAAAALYRMLAPLAADDVSIFSEPLSERARAATDREKTLVLRSIKELEFDRAMGKIAPKDFDEMVGRLRARAIMLMKQLDESAGAGYRELIERELQTRLAKGSRGSKGSIGSKSSIGSQGSVGSKGSCVTCGTANDADATFCKRCGTKLEQAETR